jgi:hypothetical protein
MFTNSEGTGATLGYDHTHARRERMPQIIVTADRTSDQGEAAVMWRERITAADLESDHFQAQLVERLGWAVVDADEAERRRQQRQPS